MTTDLVHVRIPPDAGRRHRELPSCDQQDLVANKVQAKTVRPRSIAKVRRSRLDHVLAQLVPRVTLSENALRKAFSAVAAVRLLDDLEHQFRHLSMILASAGSRGACFSLPTRRLPGSTALANPVGARRGASDSSRSRMIAATAQRLDEILGRRQRVG